MPYIDNREGRRDEIVDQLFLDLDEKGELNFAICDVIQTFLAKMDAKIGYNVLSDVAGVLGDVQHEFRRCVMDPFEDKKRQENGDVWWINERLNAQELWRGVRNATTPHYSVYDHKDMD